MTDHADTIRRLNDLVREAADLQIADLEPDNSEQRWKDLRDMLVVAALYEIPEVLAERQQAIDALREVHAAQCGCDEPGNRFVCVCQPAAPFEVLPWVKLGKRQP